MENNNITEPIIFTTDVKTRKPGANTHLRLCNQRINTALVVQYFNAIGFKTEVLGTCFVRAEHPSGIYASFYYGESSHGVYSYLLVYNNGIPCDITAIRDIANSLSPTVTAHP